MATVGRSRLNDLILETGVRFTSYQLETTLQVAEKLEEREAALMIPPNESMPGEIYCAKNQIYLVPNLNPVTTGAHKKLFEGIFLNRHKYKKVAVLQSVDKATMHVMQREIDFLQKLAKGPTIVHTYAWLGNAERYVVIQKFCNKGDLLDFIPKANPSEKQKMGLVLQLISGVSFIHHQHLVHRDLKPDNILLDDSEGALNLFITDFGCAKHFMDHGIDVPSGDIQYAAPEVLNKKPGYISNHNEDLWNLGLVIRYIFTTKLPPWSTWHPDNIPVILPGLGDREIFNLINYETDPNVLALNAKHPQHRTTLQVIGALFLDKYLGPPRIPMRSQVQHRKYGS